MKFSISREKLLPPLQLACAVVEKRQTSPILGNLLLTLESDELVITGTDLEVELTVRIPGVTAGQPGEVTVPARKLMDICRSLPEGAEMTATLEGNRVAVDSGRFSSHLSTLPVGDFPDIEVRAYDVALDLSVGDLRRLLQRTSFAMAQQDVRYFFNGLLVEVQPGSIRFVATNGQRLALSVVSQDTPSIEKGASHQFIVPRKAVAELIRLLPEDDEARLQLNFTSNHMAVESGGATLVTKLIDATYPDYTRAIPSGGDKVITADRKNLREALSRTAILSNELYRNVRLMLQSDRLDMHANNPQQEEAEETLPISYAGEPLEIGFNVSYLIEALSVMKGEQVRITLSDPGSACLIEDLDESESLFVISPMVL